MARRWAVLIDAENVAAEVADPLFARVATWGDACVRRMYGDFEGRQSPWKAKRQEHHIETIQLSDMVQGKNGADIALVIDAMDLLGRGHVDGFCLVTSDCDFTRLAWRLRADGRTVHGVGRAGAAQAFRGAFLEYAAIEDLAGSHPVGAKAPAKTVKAPRAPAAPKCATKLNPSQAVPLLRKAMATLAGCPEPHRLEDVRKALRKMSPDFDPVSYAKCTSLQSVIEKTNIFIVRKDAFGDEVVSRKT